MIEPIRLGFEVDCPVDHAFDVWTARIAQWWPKDHTVSAEQDLTVVLERRPGGRIFERLTSGVEHDWGEVTIWEPPTRLGYTWHLNRDRSDATDVEVGLSPVATRRPGWRSSTAAGNGSAPRASPGATGTTAVGRPCCRTTSWLPARLPAMKGHRGRVQ